MNMKDLCLALMSADDEDQVVDMLAAHLNRRRLTAADSAEHVFVGARGRPL